ncbi:hypothetical protein JCM12294_01690 [Desulfocicer niacini]
MCCCRFGVGVAVRVKNDFNFLLMCLKEEMGSFIKKLEGGVICSLFDNIITTNWYTPVVVSLTSIIFSELLLSR